MHQRQSDGKRVGFRATSRTAQLVAPGAAARAAASVSSLVRALAPGAALASRARQSNRACSGRARASTSERPRTSERHRAPSAVCAARACVRNQSSAALYRGGVGGPARLLAGGGLLSGGGLHGFV